MPKKNKSEQARILGNFVADMLGKPLYEPAIEYYDPWWIEMDEDESYEQQMEAEAIEREAIERGE